jgi:hypothetical protein
MNDWIWPWLVAFGLTRARCVYRGGRVAARWPARIGVFALLAATQFWLVAAHAEALLPVWALIDQDTPVAGARV